MFKQFSQSYPPPVPNQKAIITAVLFGLFIGLFLIFFEPFKLNFSKYDYKNAVLLFYGFITTGVLIFSFYLLPNLFPKFFSEEKWTVSHHIIFYAVILFVIATLNGLYTNYINSLQFSWSNYWWIISRTYLLGGIPIAFLTVLDYNRKLKRHYNDADEILKSLQTSEEIQEKQVWQVSTDLKDEIIIFDEATFLFAKAIGNYIEMHSIENAEIKKTTHRILLSSLETQLSSDLLKRCHRSYLVNLDKVEDISGNAQGLKLKLNKLPYTIPVSRKYIDQIKYLLK